jgi:hypothetical protein
MKGYITRSAQLFFIIGGRITENNNLTIAISQSDHKKKRLIGTFKIVR